MKKEASNTFKDGLIMDYNPSATPDTILTNSLNGTLVTYNGNELMLQNDMGNSCINRVRLDEGYIPTGIAEHGGIIYVASYNPETNHGQIGSFPYPKVNYYPDDFENDNETNWALKAYVNDNNIINTFSIRNSIPSEFKLPMFVHNTIDIPLLYIKGSSEQLIIHPNDSFTNILQDNFKEFIQCDGVTAKYYVLSGSTKTYIDEELDQETREQKIINGNIIYYVGKLSGKLYLEIDLDTIDNFKVSQDIVQSENGIKVTFLSDTPMYINKIQSGVNSNARERSNGLIVKYQDFDRNYTSQDGKINVTAYPITEDHGIDGTNPRDIKFNPKELIEQQQILSKYKYKWEDGVLTLDWSFQTILTSDQSSSNNKYTFNHYFYDINVVTKAIQDGIINSSDFRELISLVNSDTNLYSPSLKIIGKEEYASVSNSFEDTFNLSKGVFLHIITTKNKTSNVEEVRVLRFVYATPYLNQYFDNQDIADYNQIKYHVSHDQEWVEYLDLDIEDQLFKMEVEVEKAKYKEKNITDWSSCSTIDPIIMSDVEVQGSNEFNINPEEFYNKINITFSPNSDENNQVNINLNQSSYEEHIIDSSSIKINQSNIIINEVVDSPEYSGNNYSRLAALAQIENKVKTTQNSITINRGIYSGSSGGKQIMEKKITDLYPLYQQNQDNTSIVGFNSNESVISSPAVARKHSLTYYDRQIQHIDISNGHTENQDEDTHKSFTTEEVSTQLPIIQSIVNSYEIGTNDYNSCFNLINGFNGDEASIRLQYYREADGVYGTFDTYQDDRELEDQDFWSLLTIRDSNNKIKVLSYGGFPGDPYYFPSPYVKGTAQVYASIGDGGQHLVEVRQAAETYISNGIPAMFWIPANQKLYNFLSQIFTLRSMLGTYYIIGADGVNTVYSIPDKSYFRYSLPDSNLNTKILQQLFYIASRTSSNRKCLSLDSSCLPKLKIKGNSDNVYYYGNYINLNSYDFKYIINRYSSVYDKSYDALVTSSISDEDIYIFDWSKIHNRNLIGTTYSQDGSYIGLQVGQVVGFNPKDSSFVYNIQKAREFLTNTKDINISLFGKKVTLLKDWNGYNFYISNINDYFITVNKAKRLRPSYFNIPENGILLNANVSKENFISSLEWVADKDIDAFKCVDVCFYNHDMLQVPVYNSGNQYDEEIKKQNLISQTIDQDVQKQLYKSIQESMLNYAKTL